VTSPKRAALWLRQQLPWALNRNAPNNVDIYQNFSDMTLHGQCSCLGSCLQLERRWYETW